VARAKKTDRSEARRRARLAAGIPDSAPDASDGGRSTTPPPATAPVTARPSIFGAFRGAIRPIDLRGDLRQIPWLITRTNAVWLPSLLVIASTIWFATSGGSLRDLPGLVFNLFVFPPPLAAAFLAGILTDRMSYLAGGLVGLVSAIVFSVYVLLGPVPGTAPLTLNQREGYVLYAIGISPLSGLAIGGFAGFYRRFLRRANPQSGQRPGRGKNAKAPARR
jgi:hypothetical protein